MSNRLDQKPIAEHFSESDYFTGIVGQRVVRVLADKLLNKYGGPSGSLSTSDPDPDPGIPRWYFGTEKGTYTNLLDENEDPIVATKDLIFLIFDGTAWSIYENVLDYNLLLRREGDYIQWRNSEDNEWENLFPLSDVKGDPGYCAGTLSTSDDPEVGEDPVWYFGAGKGTYTNLLDANDEPIEGTKDVVILVWNGEYWELVEYDINLNLTVTNELGTAGEGTSLDNWVAGYTDITIVDNTFNYDMGVASGGHISITPGISGNKFYFKQTYVAGDATRVCSVYLNFNTQGAKSNQLYIPTVASGILTATASYNRLTIAAIGSVQENKYRQFKHFILIDLTKLYGAGSEPSLSDFESLLLSITSLANYFNYSVIIDKFLWENKRILVEQSKSINIVQIGSDAEAIQLLRLYNDSLIFQGFASITTPTPQTPTLNHAWIVVTTGTVLGIAAVKGQIIYYSGSAYVAANISQNIAVTNELGTAGEGTSLDNWVAGYTGITIVDNTFNYDMGVASGGHISITPGISGNKFYFKQTYVAGDATRVCTVFLNFNTQGAKSNQLYIPTVASGILTATASYNRLTIAATGAAQSGKYRQFKHFILIDLTKIYGAGSEPSLSDFESLLLSITSLANYFNYSVTIDKFLWENKRILVEQSKSINIVQIGSDAEAIQLLRLYNDSLIFQGFASITTPTPETPTLNHAWIVVTTGTVLGIAAVKGQIIYYSGSAYVAANISQNIAVTNELGTAGEGTSLDNWVAGYTDITIIDNTFNYDMGVASGGHISITPGISGNKFYFKQTYVAGDATRVCTVFLNFNTQGVKSNQLYIPTVASGILTATASYNRLTIAATGSVQTNKYRQFKHFILIDLTKLYGAGSEPSLSDFEILLSSISSLANYFNFSKLVDRILWEKYNNLIALIKGWILSESYSLSNIVFVNNIISSADLVFPNGTTGSISNVVSGSYGITSIQYNLPNGKYFTLSISYNNGIISNIQIL